MEEQAERGERERRGQLLVQSHSDPETTGFSSSAISLPVINGLVARSLGLIQKFL